MLRGSWSTNFTGRVQLFEVTRGLAKYTEDFDPYQIGSVSGTVYEKANGVYIPCAQPVYVYDRSSGLRIRATTSDSLGHYEFNDLWPGMEYYVMAIDNTSPIQRSAIVDKVVPS